MGNATLFSFETYPPIEGMVFALGKAADNVHDTQSLLEGFGQIFTGLMQKQFASEGSLAGGWAALSEPYATWKAATHPGAPIGVLSGALRSAMTGGAGYTERIGSEEASYGLGGGPASVYGKYFSGGGRGPARPVIKWGTGEVRQFQKYAHEWLHRALDVAGGHATGSASPSLLGGLV